jgi:hypothetical protein
VLDCIYDKGNDEYLVLDVLVWNGVSIAENSTEYRFFFLSQNVFSDPALTKRDEINEIKFSRVPYYDCNPEGLQTAYISNYSFAKDGKIVRSLLVLLSCN